MTRLEHVAPIDGLSGAIDSTRRGLASVDRDTLGDAASSAARTVLPRGWFRPKPRRWPFVVATLLIAAMVASVFLARQTLTTSDNSSGPTSRPKSQVDSEPDASDVVEGPVGSASLRDPASSDPQGADLSRLLEIEVDPDAGEPASPTVG